MIHLQLYSSPTDEAAGPEAGPEDAQSLDGGARRGGTGLGCARQQGVLESVRETRLLEDVFLRRQVSRTDCGWMRMSQGENEDVEEEDHTLIDPAWSNA